MAKKSVISNRATNPALQFFSQQPPTVEEVPEVIDEPAVPPMAEEPVPVIPEVAEPPVVVNPVAPIQPPAAMEKPAASDELDALFTSFSVPEGYRLISKETRSHRLQLLLTPTLYDKVKRAANAHGLKVNDYIHRILDMATKDL